MKGIAIIGVTLFHMFPNAIRGGYLGVSLFFVISGYLLAFTSLQQWQRGTFTVRQYFKKRLQRLYPPLVIMVLTTVGIYSYLLPQTMAHIQGEALSILLGYNNWWQITQQADYFARMANASPFTPLWFLSIEMQYIVLWVFLFGLYIFLAHKWRPSVGIGVIAVLGIATAAIMPLRYVPGQDVTPLYYGTDTRIYALFFGAVLGLVRANRQGKGTYFTPRGQVVLASLFFICVVVTLLGFLKLDGQNPLVYQGLMLAFTLVCCLMILLCESPHLSIGRYMDMPVLAWLGRNSYGIFLWQYPVLCMAHRMHWEVAFTSPYIYYCVLVSLILLLTSWTDELVKVLLDTDARRAFLATCKRSYTVALTVMAIGFMMIGFRSIAVDTTADEADSLQSRLAVNAAEQQEANQQAVAGREVSQNELSGIVGIGDSVMLGASPQLRKVLPHVIIDAKVSRYVGNGVDVAKTIANNQQLGHIVLIGLGTNGPITGYYENKTKALVDYLGPDREIFWVNTYAPHLSWQDENNQYLANLAKTHKNITIIDWYGFIKDHPELLADDGVHPNDKGAAAYADLVAKAIRERLGQQMSK